VPEEMIRLAKEKTQEIQMAYAVIRKSRSTAAA
jgi:DnaJ-domain-containing protein 1